MTLSGDTIARRAAHGARSICMVTAAALAADACALPGADATTSDGLTVVTRATEDTFVRSSRASTNYGTSPSLEIDGGSSSTRRALLRFPLTQVAGQTVTRATVRLYVAGNDSARPGGLYAVNGAWSEATTTWATAPVPGATLAPLSAPAVDGAWITADVTAAVATAAHARSASISFYVLGDPSDGFAFAARESGANAPEIAIDTVVGAGTDAGAADARATDAAATPDATTPPDDGSVPVVRAVSIGGGGSSSEVTTSSGVVTHGAITTTPYTIGWLLRCDYSHSASDDPIVFPGQPGLSHRHDFFGNTTTSAYSTYRSMLETPTTQCGTAADTAGYWAPSLLVRGAALRPDQTSQQIYYRNKYPSGTLVEPFPSDLRVIVGMAHATSIADNPALAAGHIYWECTGTSSDTHYALPPSCSSGQALLNIEVPSCWDGVSTHANDTTHLAYGPDFAACPAAFSHPLPRLSIKIKYAYGTDGSVVTLASGAAYTTHADFWNTWSPVGLRYLVDRCLNAHVSCGTDPIAPLN